MFDEIPTHRDRALAMRSVLAVMNDDGLAIQMVTLEIDDAKDLDRLFLALCDCFQAFIRDKTDDPLGYILKWIDYELGEAASTE